MTKVDHVDMTRKDYEKIYTCGIGVQWVMGQAT
jgi:hypothetical protein